MVFKRTFNGWDNICKGSKMKNEIYILEKRFNCDIIANVVMMKMNFCIVLMMFNILNGSAGEVINNNHFNTFLYKQINHMTANESTSTSNKCFHFIFIFLI